MNKKTRKIVVFGALVAVLVFSLVLASQLRREAVIREEESFEEQVPGVEETASDVTGYSIEDQLKERNQEIIDRAKAIEEAELEAIRHRIYHFAIFATDERADEIPRSDIIMILEYNPKEHQVTLVSTPRDTRVMIPGKYRDKINHAYAFGGPSLMQETLEAFYKVEIEYFLRVNFDDFTQLINQLGGVSVNAKKDYNYPGRIDIAKGLQVLDGKSALDYVRFRYDEDGDYGRILRQQEIVKSLLDKLSNRNEDEVEQYLTEFYGIVDTDLTIEELRNLYRVYDIKTALDFQAYTLKTRGRIINGIWYELYDEKDLERLQTLFQNSDEWP